MSPWNESVARLDGATCHQADFRGARLANASDSPADLEAALNVPAEVK